jgi:hypothetical protein
MWFSCTCFCVQRVKSITKAHFIDHRNNNKDTAEALFATTNIKLRDEAREWLRHTAEGCSIVAVLIATVAFAAAYTIPGGPNQSTGVPVLFYHPFFVVFTATDVLSVTSALTSVLIFLSILIATFRLEDFKHSLPNKLMLGFTFLFLSVSMMMISFSATIILMISSKRRWTKILLYSLSFLPGGISTLAYFPLYLSLLKTKFPALGRVGFFLKRIIIRAFPWPSRFSSRFSSLSKKTYLYNNREPQISSSSIGHQLRSKSTSSQHNPEGEDFCSQDKSQTSWQNSV